MRGRSQDRLKLQLLAAGGTGAQKVEVFGVLAQRFLVHGGMQGSLSLTHPFACVREDALSKELARADRVLGILRCWRKIRGVENIDLKLKQRQIDAWTGNLRCDTELTGSGVLEFTLPANA